MPGAETLDSMDTGLNIQFNIMFNTEVVDLTGDLDIYTCRSLVEAITCLICKGELLIVVNMENVRYIDSFGLSALVESLCRVKENQGYLAISNIKPHVEKALSVTGLGRILDVFSDAEEAIHTLKSRLADAESSRKAA